MRTGTINRRWVACRSAVLSSLVVILTCSCGCITWKNSLPQQAMVARVVDGDTLILLEDKTVVRLLGINAPERSQAYFADAKRLLDEIVRENNVRLEYDVQKWDKMKKPRLLAYVFSGDTFVNLELVRRGMAEADVLPPNVNHKEEIMAAEAEARKAALGIWSAGPKPDVNFIGNKDSKKFHKSDCEMVDGISPRNRVTFDVRDAAKDQGYQPCKSCKP